MALKIAACVRDGIVVNAAVYDEDTSAGWLAAVKPQFDSVLIVDQAAIGWEEYKKGKVRMPQPSADCTWNETDGVWVFPDPEPEPEVVP